MLLKLKVKHITKTFSHSSIDNNTNDHNKKCHKKVVWIEFWKCCPLNKNERWMALFEWATFSWFDGQNDEYYRLRVDIRELSRKRKHFPNIFRNCYLCFGWNWELLKTNSVKSFPMSLTKKLVLWWWFGQTMPLQLGRRREQLKVAKILYTNRKVNDSIKKEHLNDKKTTIQNYTKATTRGFFVVQAGFAADRKCIKKFGFDIEALKVFR